MTTPNTTPNALQWTHQIPRQISYNNGHTKCVTINVITGRGGGRFPLDAPSQLPRQMRYIDHTKSLECCTMTIPRQMHYYNTWPRPIPYHSKCVTMATPNTTPNELQWSHQMCYNDHTKYQAKYIITVVTTPNVLQWWPRQIRYNGDHAKCVTMVTTPNALQWPHHITMVTSNKQ